MIDIGANLTNPAFADDFDAMMRRAIDGGVERIIVTGTDLDSSAAAVALCAIVYTAPLLHRWRTSARCRPRSRRAGSIDLEKLAGSRAVRAIGETGLDFNRNYSPHAVQRACSTRSWQLAARLQLPVFVHDRDSNGAPSPMR